ncbi:MAG: type II toxin-antitoxin system prevent-host-death family antitoxin [Kiritimatiellaeota bacterium]|nr:type II toxin-antitoxin system prevent-host-death family antitoxin [Kiritimatiellota bacterium]
MTSVLTAKRAVDLDALVNRVARTNKPVKIKTPTSACVLVSDEEWRGIQEKLYLQSIPGVWESVVEGMKAPLSEFVDADSVEWDV